MKSQYLIIIILRIITPIFLISNYHHPDQYWQGPQIAHRISYGYGYQTWEWTIDQPIRSPIYPIYLSIAYFIVSILTSNSTIITFAPWLINMLIAILADIFLLKIIQTIYGNINIIVKICIITNWFYLSTMSRTFINGLQASLTLIAYYFWINRDKAVYNDLFSRLIVGICYISRPTSLIIWAIIWPYQLIQLKKGHLRFIMVNICQILVMITSSLFLSWIWSGKMQLTQLNFVKYNILLKWSDFYGKHHFLTYILIFVPLLMGMQLPSLLSSILNIVKWKKIDEEIQLKFSRPYLKEMLIQIVFFLLILSFSSHKEPRFLLTILPFLIIISTLTLKNYNQKLLIIIIIINFAILFSFNTFGKNGGLQAIKYLRQNITDKSAIVIMGESHFLPLYCILHRNVNISLPDSSPILKIQMKDQQDFLRNDPEKLFQILSERNKGQVDYIIAQETYIKYTENIIKNHQFKEIKRWKNCNIFQQIFTQCDGVIIFHKQNTKPL